MGNFSVADLEYMFWAGIRNGSIGTVGGKGDPGGIITTAVPVNTDLNTLSAPGSYAIVAGADAAASAAANLPLHQAGALLTVLSNGNTSSVHMFISNTASIYVRRLNAGTWSAWRHFGQTRVDQTAGRVMFEWDPINNREQLIYGDTGWRVISSWDAAGVVTGDPLPTGFAVQAGRAGGIYFRRKLYDVSLVIIGATTTNTAQQVPVPPGFQVGNAPYFNIPIMHSTGVAVALAGASVLYTFFPNGALVGNGDSSFGSLVTWPTSQVWPTALPGTPSGVIPNL